MGIFSKFKKQKENLAIVLDLGSSSVGGAVFRARKGSAPQMIYSVREEIMPEKNFNFEKFMKSALQALEEIARDIVLRGFGRPRRVFVVLASPWHVSEIRTINYSKNTSFTFSVALAEGLIEKEIALFQSELNRKYKREKMRPIELKNIKIALNGYVAPEPLNQKAQELAMTLFIAMSSENVLNQIEEGLARHFRRGDIKFSSFTMAAFAVARDLFQEDSEFILIDIGGEVTDMSMVKEEELREAASFPIGANFIFREIAAELSATLPEAKSLFYLYKDGHGDTASTARLEPIMKSLKSKWLQSFQESLANLSHDLSIPSTIFFTAEKELAGFFAELIKGEQFNQYTLTDSKFKVIPLHGATLAPFAGIARDASPDPYLLIACVYLSRTLSVKF